VLLAGERGIGEEPFAGVGLYYGVLAFNLGLTAWIQEWSLLVAGVALHLVLAGTLLTISRQRRMA
jgi:putative membrane protein